MGHGKTWCVCGWLDIPTYPPSLVLFCFSGGLAFCNILLFLRPSPFTDLLLLPPSYHPSLPCHLHNIALLIFSSWPLSPPVVGMAWHAMHCLPPPCLRFLRCTACICQHYTVCMWFPCTFFCLHGVARSSPVFLHNNASALAGVQALCSWAFCIPTYSLLTSSHTCPLPSAPYLAISSFHLLYSSAIVSAFLVSMYVCCAPVVR